MKQSIIQKSKKYTVLILATVFISAFSACEKKADPANEAQKETAPANSKNEANVKVSFSVVSNTMIRETAGWNGFTDLHGYNGNLYIVYREASSHTAHDGKIRVLRYNTSTFQWDGIQLISYAVPSGYVAADLRDPKLSTNPNNGTNGLMLTVAVRLYESNGDSALKTLTYHSSNGVTWTAPNDVTALNGGWLWRVEWRPATSTAPATAYGFRYAGNAIKLMSSTTGTSFSTVTNVNEPTGATGANETGLVFNTGNNDKMIAVARHDVNGVPQPAKVGFGNPPYTSIQWYDSGIRIGGPDVFRMENGAIIAGFRRYNGAVQYPALYLIHTGAGSEGTMSELVRFVSGDAGDSGYPGIWKYGSQIWVSYYSSHGGGGKARIYLAKLNFTL